MFRIESQIDTSGSEFKENYAHHQAIAETYRQRMAEIGKGGPEKYRERHKSRGKLLARERLNKLFDRNTPFLELNPMAAYDRYDD